MALEVTQTKPQVQFQTCFKTKIEPNLSLNPILILGFMEEVEASSSFVTFICVAYFFKLSCS